MRRSTIIYILLLVIMMGAYYYLNHRPEPAADSTGTPEPQAQVSYLFTPGDGVPTSIHIESKAGETVEVARDAGNTWGVILPTKAAADQGSVDAASNQITVMQILDHLPDIAPKDVGLDDPEYKMNIKFTGNVERNLEVGVITPTQNGYYVRLDGGEIVIVSKSALDSLLGLLSNPPYMPTETPPPPAP